MAKVDAFISYLLWYYVSPIFMLCVLFTIFVKKIFILRQKWIASFLNWKLYNEIWVKTNVKEILFADLYKIKSGDLNLKNRGLIRILEIGSSLGSNFRYYPKNSRLIVIENNPYIKYYFIKKLKLFPELTVESYLNGFAETLFLIPDSSIDVVVSTEILCRVQNNGTVLKEIKRILIPGGKFFYIEHMQHCIGSWRYHLQHIIDPLWKIIFDGCSLTQDLVPLIEQNQFSDVIQCKVHQPWGNILEIFLNPLLIGIATK